jgi:hypothetical protein
MKTQLDSSRNEPQDGVIGHDFRPTRDVAVSKGVMRFIGLSRRTNGLDEFLRPRFPQPDYVYEE